VKDRSVAGGAEERHSFRDAFKYQQRERERIGMRRSGDNDVSDVLGGYIPNITSGCHRRRHRGSSDLFPDFWYSEVADQRFALSRARSAPTLRVGCGCGIHLGGDKHVFLPPFCQSRRFHRG